MMCAIAHPTYSDPFVLCALEDGHVGDHYGDGHTWRNGRPGAYTSGTKRSGGADVDEQAARATRMAKSIRPHPNSKAARIEAALERYHAAHRELVIEMMTP